MIYEMHTFGGKLYVMESMRDFLTEIPSGMGLFYIVNSFIAFLAFQKATLQ